MGVCTSTPPSAASTAASGAPAVPPTASATDAASDPDVWWAAHGAAHPVVRLRPPPSGATVGAQPPDTVRFVVVSDTHTQHHKLVMPPGDILIHCGDFTNAGSRAELRSFRDWLGVQRTRYRQTVVVAGNHDLSLDPATWQHNQTRFAVHNKGVGGADDAAVPLTTAEAVALLTDGGYCTYLHDTEVMSVVGGYRIFGSPYSPQHADWAFGAPRGAAMRAIWERIPIGADVVVTHGPPVGHGDQSQARRLGCVELRERIERHVRPLVHAFGHVHASYGWSHNRPADAAADPKATAAAPATAAVVPAIAAVSALAANAPASTAAPAAHSKASSAAAREVVSCAVLSYPGVQYINAASVGPRCIQQPIVFDLPLVNPRRATHTAHTAAAPADAVTASASASIGPSVTAAEGGVTSVGR